MFVVCLLCGLWAAAFEFTCGGRLWAWVFMVLLWVWFGLGFLLFVFGFCSGLIVVGVGWWVLLIVSFCMLAYVRLGYCCLAGGCGWFIRLVTVAVCCFLGLTLEFAW